MKRKIIAVLFSLMVTSTSVACGNISEVLEKNGYNYENFESKLSTDRDLLYDVSNNFSGIKEQLHDTESIEEVERETNHNTMINAELYGAESIEEVEHETNPDTMVYADELEVVEEEKDLTYAILYKNQIDELYSSGIADQFALINVNGDDIPELAASSSEGRWDIDQVFIYTVFEEQIFLLVSDVAPGVEGHYIAYYEGENLIETSGAVSGECFTYYSINQGCLEPIFSVASYDMPDEYDEFIRKYWIDEQEVTETEYSQKIDEFLNNYGIPIMLGSDVMHIASDSHAISYCDNQNEGSRSYMSYSEIIEKLGRL